MVKGKMRLSGIRAVADVSLTFGDYEITLLHRGKEAPQITLRLHSCVSKERKSGYFRLESHIENRALWTALVEVCKEHGDWHEEGS